MNAAPKLLAAMRRSPLDWQIGNLQTVARQNGVEWRHQKSSHCVRSRRRTRLVSPRTSAIKPVHIRKFAELIDGA